ncbi:hypothetical protein [Mammaliicoccus sciuri]|uniref:hypothetical protein n=1 Tax=Mammaliicoccus sciuri TaxID=1296 RepID=UPI00194F4DD0|nr:hypothetical protein [Mammaliicoccus sciuri]MEB6096063.1 hypothetical protein [Mammaliicoccus sciuri]MEB8129139.1 hypothetical protein [Mammaliicoccus sciuri]
MTNVLSLVIVKKTVQIHNLHQLVKVLNEKFDTFYTILYYQESYYHKVRILDAEKREILQLISNQEILVDSEIYIDQYIYEESKYGMYKDFVESHFIDTSNWIANNFVSNNKFKILESLILDKLEKLPIKDRSEFLDYSFYYWHKYAEKVNFKVNSEIFFEIDTFYKHNNSCYKLDNDLKNNLEKLHNLSSNKNTNLNIPYFKKNEWNDYKKLIFSLNHMDANKLGVFPNSEAIFYYYLKEVYFGK